jgi:hypothetical protein
MNRDPERRAKASATLRITFADPEIREKRAEATRRGIRRSLADPAMREKRQKAGREFGAKNIHHTRSAEVRAKAGRAISETKMAHIPPAYRAEYRHLIVKKHVLKRDATRIVLAKAERAKLAGLSPDLAANHLRRLTSVFRCDETGKIDPVGTHWRYGTRILERFDLIKLAIDKGADPERLVA